MRIEDCREEFYDFLEEYADFIAQMSRDEDEKLAALLSNHLERIERALAIAQANTKQLENIEQRRMRLQEQAGYGGMTFSEIVENSGDEERAWLQGLFRYIQTNLESIRFHNRKSMNVARVNVMLTTKGAEMLAGRENPVTDAYKKTKTGSEERDGGFLETTI